MTRKEGMEKKKCEIKVNVVRKNRKEMEEAGRSGKAIEDDVNVIGDNRKAYGQVCLKKATIDFIRGVERENFRKITR